VLLLQLSLDHPAMLRIFHQSDVARQYTAKRFHEFRDDLMIATREPLAPEVVTDSKTKLVALQMHNHLENQPRLPLKHKLQIHILVWIPACRANKVTKVLFDSLENIPGNLAVARAPWRHGFTRCNISPA
jgi:hypothetical protein